MYPPNRELYQERMRALGRAIVATKQALDVGVYSRFGWSALVELRLMRLETWVDYRHRLDQWNKDQQQVKAEYVD